MSGALVIYAPVVMKEKEKFDESEFDPHSYTQMYGLFTEGTWNCNFADEVKPNVNDVILSGRTNFSAFEGTDLKNVLERNGVRQLFLMGFLTNVCVLDTSQAASDEVPQIKVYVPLDGCAAKSAEEHFGVSQAGLSLDSTVITCSEAQTMLQLLPPAELLLASIKVRSGI